MATSARNETMNGAFLLEIPKVRNAASEIKRQPIATDVDEVSYYTTFDTFKYVLPSSATSKKAIGCLSIMNVVYMNDPSEGKMLVSYLGGETLTPSAPKLNWVSWIIAVEPSLAADRDYEAKFFDVFGVISGVLRMVIEVNALFSERNAEGTNQICAVKNRR